MEFRNPGYNVHGSIDCEINHPAFGWIPFTASVADPDPSTAHIYAAIMESEEPIAPYAPPAVSLEDAKSALLAALATRRWQAEEAGIVIGGVPIKTDRESQTKLTGAYLKADRDPEFTISNWKVAEGLFVTLDAATIIATGDAVTAHVQACFDKEAELTADILAAADAAALAVIDIESGWPGSAQG